MDKAFPDRRLAQALVADEPEDAVPTDQTLLAPGETSVTLMLPTGTYRVVLQDEAGNSEILEPELAVE